MIGAIFYERLIYYVISIHIRLKSYLRSLEDRKAIQLVHICTCEFPILVIDNRKGKGIEYLAMPIEIIKGGEVPVPDIEYEETEGLDGIIRSYIAVTWQRVKEGDFVKKYDIVGHVVTAGCRLEDASKVEAANAAKDGKTVCDEKNIYVVHHPIDEWINQHIIELPLEVSK